MKFLFAKLSAIIAVLFLSVELLFAAPSSLEPAQFSFTGQMNDLIGALVNRNDAQSVNLLSRVYYATEQWDAAIKNGERAVSMQPDNSNYHMWLGRAYGQKAANVNPLSAAGLAKKAKNEFERAVQLDPANVQARADLSEYYAEAPSFMGGGTDKARSQAEQVQNLDPATANWIRAIAAQKDKRYADAENNFKLAIASSPNPAEYWLNLASFYRQCGRLDDMERAVQSALAQPNKSPIAYYNAANELFEAGRNLPGAAQYVKKYLASGASVEDAPGFRAHYLLGQIYSKGGDKTQAAAEYQASLSLASGFGPARKALDQLH
jgi:tetratricopeptide (TPR) repeat protein